MPSVMTVTGTGAVGPSATRRAARLAVKGEQRKMCKKLQHYCNIILQRDFKEQTRADQVGYNPLLFTVRSGNKVEKALMDIIARCDAMLKQTV